RVLRRRDVVLRLRDVGRVGMVGEVGAQLVTEDGGAESLRGVDLVAGVGDAGRVGPRRCGRQHGHGGLRSSEGYEVEKSTAGVALTRRDVRYQGQLGAVPDPRGGASPTIARHLFREPGPYGRLPRNATRA